MRICGLNKTTLLDYPGRVACTIFIGGCNFRCPFCQNGGLVLSPLEQPGYEEEEVFRLLEKRRGVLDGVCVTGGEPTLVPELPDFLKEIKQLGYDIKLDTNGSRPQVVRGLAEAGLVDKVAVDIKACPENYGILTGLEKPDVEAVKETVEFLMKGSLDYEFRTTVVKELHKEKDFREIGLWLKGAKAYFLQAYRDSEEVIRPGFTSYSREELENFREILLENIPNVGIRGID